MNSLSVELCDPHYIPAFSTLLQTDSDPYSIGINGSTDDHDGTRLMDIEFVCYVEDCVSDTGAESQLSLFTNQDIDRRLSGAAFAIKVAPAQRDQTHLQAPEKKNKNGIF